MRPATSACSMTTGTCPSSTARRTSSSAAARTSRHSRSRSSCCACPVWPRWPWWPRPTPGSGSTRARSSGLCRARTRRRSTRSGATSRARAWRARSGLRRCGRSRSSRARRRARSRSSHCATGSAPSLPGTPEPRFSAARTSLYDPAAAENGLAAAADPLDEQGALHLARGRCAGELVHDLETARLLEAGERAGAVGAQLAEVERVLRARLGHHDRAHDLAPLRVGQADDRDLADPRVRDERRLDLARRHRLAAGPDDVARPALDRQVALVVEGAEVAGVVPAVAQRLGGRVGLVEVAVHEQLAADADLAVLELHVDARL